MTIHHYDPVEVIEGAVPFRFRAVTLALAAAALIMLLFGAKPLLDWVNALPIGPSSDALLGFSVAWSDLCDTLHLNTVFTATQEWFRQFQALRF
jgi:hypothetical protein